MFFLGGALGTTAYHALLNWGQREIPAGPAAFLIATAPMWGLALAPLVGERAPRGVWGGIAVALAGVALISWGQSAAKSPTGTSTFAALLNPSALLILGAAFAGGASGPVYRRLLDAGRERAAPHGRHDFDRDVFARAIRRRLLRCARGRATREPLRGRVPGRFSHGRGVSGVDIRAAARGPHARAALHLPHPGSGLGSGVGAAARSAGSAFACGRGDRAFGRGVGKRSRSPGGASTCAGAES
jgi:hypothetical protein